MTRRAAAASCSPRKGLAIGIIRYLSNYWASLRTCVFRLVSIPPAQKPGGDTGDYSKRGNIPGDNGAGSNDTSFTDRHARQQDRTCANISPSFYTDRPNLKIGFNNRLVDRETGVR